METITAVFDLGKYLTGVMMALVVALFVVVAGYELALTFVRKAAFERKMRRRMKNA